MIYYEYIFDYIYNVDTKGFVPFDKLNTKGSKQNCVIYQASNYFLLKKLINKYPTLLTDKNIVDFGSGKGRILLFAMQHSAKKCVGIEFAKELVDISNKNLYNFSKKAKSKTSYEIIYDDVRNFQFSGFEDILFFYNPFDDIIINDLISKIKKLKKKFTIIYINPIHKELFDKEFSKFDNIDDEIAIYKT